MVVPAVKNEVSLFFLIFFKDEVETKSYIWYEMIICENPPDRFELLMSLCKMCDLKK